MVKEFSTKEQEQSKNAHSWCSIRGHGRCDKAWKKDIKGIHVGKDEVKLPFTNMPDDVENSKNLSKNY